MSICCCAKFIRYRMYQILSGTVTFCRICDKNDFQFTECRFESWLGATTYWPLASYSVTKQYNLVPAKGR